MSVMGYVVYGISTLIMLVWPYLYMEDNIKKGVVTFGDIVITCALCLVSFIPVVNFIIGVLSIIVFIISTYEYYKDTPIWTKKKASIMTTDEHIDFLKRKRRQYES